MAVQFHVVDLSCIQSDYRSHVRWHISVELIIDDVATARPVLRSDRSVDRAEIINVHAWRAVSNRHLVVLH
jgi:hypothetical protein